MVFITSNTPSSKNSKQRTRAGHMIFSATVLKYLKEHGIQGFSSRKKEVQLLKTKQLTFPVDDLKELFKDKEYPIVVGFHFVRGSKHKFDFNNVTQLLLDLFTAFDIIEDDNMDCIIPQCMWSEGKPFSYDKEKPGVYIKILNKGEDEVY